MSRPAKRDSAYGVPFSLQVDAADRVLQLVAKRNCEKSVGHLVGVGVRSDYRASRVDPLRMGSGSRGKVNRGVSTDSSQEAVEHTRTVLKVADDIAIEVYV